MLLPISCSQPERIGLGERFQGGLALVEKLFPLPLKALGRNRGEVHGKGSADREIVQVTQVLLKLLQQGRKHLAALTCLTGGEKRSEELSAVAQLLDADAQFVALLVTE